MPPVDSPNMRREPRNLRRTFHGIPLVIEYLEGDVKTYDDQDWGYTMYADYGYIPGTTTNEEGEGLDVYVGPDADSKRVFVSALMRKDDPDAFDEYKILLGFETHKKAQEFCREQYYDQSTDMIMEMTLQDLMAWADIQQPMADKLVMKLEEEEAAEMEAREALDREPEPILVMEG